MKIITLRIGEEEKARLEQLAEAGDVTLSRAFREGAALYLNGFQERRHRARGGEATLHGVRRDKEGRPLTKRTEPARVAARRAARLRAALYDDGLMTIREAWELGAKPAVVLSALLHWLDLVGEVYASQPGEIGRSWFIRDYCREYTDRDARMELLRDMNGALFRVQR